MNAFEQGQSTEAAVLSILLSRGIPVALPIGVKRFDLLVELDGRFQKAQVKTARHKNGALVFKLGTTHPITGKNRPYTSQQVDLFLAFDPQSRKIYRVPFNLVGKLEFTLRLEPPKRMTVPRTRTIHLATDFEL